MIKGFFWSECRDSNPRPLGPEYVSGRKCGTFAPKQACLVRRFAYNHAKSPSVSTGGFAVLGQNLGQGGSPTALKLHSVYLGLHYTCW